VPNQDATPGVGLMERSLRQRGGNGIAIVAIPSDETGHKRQNSFNLTSRIQISRQ
jgi:hypothetical protein